MQKVTEIRLGPNGEVEIEGHGFKGKECMKEAELIVEALGGQVLDTKKKTEWFLTNSKALRRERRVGVAGDKLCG